MGYDSIFDVLFFQNFSQGVLGIKVKIMLPWDPQGKIGPKQPLPDHVSVVEPKEDPPRAETQTLIAEAVSSAVAAVMEETARPAEGGYAF